MTAKSRLINIELPQDIIFAMRGLRGVEAIRQKLKVSLAVMLFQEQAISLGKAAKLAEMSRLRFIELLKKYDIPAYEYTEEDFDRDQQTIAKYLEISKA